jgi:hypothetical protein
VQLTGLRRYWKTLIVYFCVVTAAGVSLSSCQRKGEPANQNSVTNKSVDQERVMLVDPGDEPSGIAYYEAILNELDLNPNKLSGKQLVDATDLPQLMTFLGYGDLNLKDIEDSPSAELMKRFPEDILSAGFFAPKITDVSVTPINPGWRKVVRFKAKGDAAKKGISAAYLLFNKFQGVTEADYDNAPFGKNSKESKNTQLILVRAAVGADLKYPIYFLVFNAFSDHSKLITFLTATFDARAPNIVAENKYYVPNACADCHGGLTEGETPSPEYAKLKLNYLDTDHWFDRLEDDFAFLKKHTCGRSAPCPVLYDAEDASQFEKAFDVFRKLNSEIQEQNSKVEPADSFQLRAVTKWIDLHKADSSHKDVFARALSPTVAGGEPWKADVSPDKDLLPLMNRYCFRCHSSLRYSIFDRPAVVGEKKNILRFMTLDIKNPLKMPQDRNLDCWLADKEKILDLVRLLPGPTPPPKPTPSPTCPTSSPSP